MVRMYVCTKDLSKYGLISGVYSEKLYKSFCSDIRAVKLNQLTD